MIRYGISTPVVRQNRQLTLRVAGKMSFDQADEIQRVFVNSLHICDHLVVNLEQIQQADFSFCMILCVTHRTAEMLNKKLTIKGALPVGSAKHFDYILHSQHHGCRYSSKKNKCILRYLEVATDSTCPGTEKALTPGVNNTRLKVEFDYGRSGRTQRVIGGRGPRSIEC